MKISKKKTTTPMKPTLTAKATPVKAIKKVTIPSPKTRRTHGGQNLKDTNILITNCVVSLKEPLYLAHIIYRPAESLVKIVYGTYTLKANVDYKIKKNKWNEYDSFALTSKFFKTIPTNKKVITLKLHFDIHKKVYHEKIEISNEAPVVYITVEETDVCGRIIQRQIPFNLILNQIDLKMNGVSLSQTMDYQIDSQRKIITTSYPHLCRPDVGDLISGTVNLVINEKLYFDKYKKNPTK